MNFLGGIRYGFGVLATIAKLWLQRRGLVHLALFSSSGRKLELKYYQKPGDAPVTEKAEKL
jgi:hypothetical protein